MKIGGLKYMSMKFVKGMMIGGLVSAGIVMMCNESNIGMNKKKMIKKGKQWVRKMGII